MKPPPEHLNEELRRYFGFSTFRPLQEEIITGLLQGENSFVLMPTGGGKSLCYQLPALLLPGLTVVVSPLIALMKDQVDTLREAGIAATFINSTLDLEEMDRRSDQVRRGEIKLLYVAPERLLTPNFLNLIDQVELSLLAIDEAHCISEWGHDFRVDYRHLSTLRERYPETTVIAMTATANERVREDILEQLQFGEETRTFVAGFDRPNLSYSVEPRSKQSFNQITRVVDRHRGASGIIYCLSRKETEKIATRLQKGGYRALPYHAGLERNERDRNQEAFERDETDIICATIAFGMGIDKPDVRFVIHHSLPKNIMSYYQETGRAGRDGLPSECLLLYARADRARLTHFISQVTDEFERRNSMKHLEEMTRYAETGECRRKVLLGHFGEEYPRESCENCDNCTNPEGVELFDATTMAQKFLSTVVRLRESFGMAYTIDVLRGSEAQKILSNRHTEISTYGIGRDQPKREWQWLGNALLGIGLVEQRVERYNTLHVTAEGWKVLTGTEKVVIKRQLARPVEKGGEQKRRRAGALPPLPERNQILFEKLRILRKELAVKRGVPPFVIFGDRTLHGIASTLPRTIGEFLKVHGVGEGKASRHGEIFLEEVALFLEAHPETSPLSAEAQRPIPAPLPPPDPDDLGDSPLETGELLKRGLGPEQIATERNLSATTIEKHIIELIRHGVVRSLTSIVEQEKAEMIRAVFEEEGRTILRPVMDRIGEERVSWFELRAVRAYDQLMEEDPIST